MLDMEWLKQRCKDIPWHNGWKLSGLQKALIYFQILNEELNSNELSSDVADYKVELERGLDRLRERIKKVSGSNEKEAGAQTTL